MYIRIRLNLDDNGRVSLNDLNEYVDKDMEDEELAYFNLHKR